MKRSAARTEALRTYITIFTLLFFLLSGARNGNFGLNLLPESLEHGGSFLSVRTAGLQFQILLKRRPRVGRVGLLTGFRINRALHHGSAAKLIPGFRVGRVGIRGFFEELCRACGLATVDQIGAHIEVSLCRSLRVPRV